MGPQTPKPGAVLSVRGGPGGTAAHRDRRGDLLRAATEIVREIGFVGASVKAITSRAGVSTGLLYSYANNSDELLCEVFRDYAGVELAAVDTAVKKVTMAGGSAVLRLITLVDTFAERALRGRSLARALLVEPVSRAIEIERHTYRRSYADMMTDIVAFGVCTAEFAPQDPSVTAAGLIGAISEAMAGPLSPLSATPDTPDTEYDERVVTLIRELCLRAVGAQAGNGNGANADDNKVHRDNQENGDKP